MDYTAPMEKLDERQKQMVIQKMRELKANPGLLAKYDKDGDGVVSPEEWEKARRDIVRQALKSGSSRVFEVAPILKKKNRGSPLTLWMYDHKDFIGTLCIVIGVAMIITDPGTFAERGPDPFAWGERGMPGNLSLIKHWLNWTSSGWGGLVMMGLGLVWGKFARFFLD